jgi:transcriptional regulator with XRE-family HTH domain
MRSARGWTLGALARAAGVDKSAISRWEAGKRQPRMPELEAVLKALNATDAQRALLFSRITAPRAVRSTRQTAVGMGLSAPPTTGDLLRAMRGRIDWSEDHLAARLGVDRTTIAHWENGDRLPGRQRIQALCIALGASAEEAVALATRRISHGSDPNVTGRAIAGLSLSECLDIITQPPPPGLEDLHYLSLERDMWELAVTRPAAIPLLARVYVYHGHHHRLAERWAASRQPATKALALAVAHPEDSVTLSRAILLKAAIAVFERQPPMPERGLYILRE